MTRIDGCITVEIGDWSDELTISADCEDVVEIMRDNDIGIHDLLEHFDVPVNVDMNSVIGFIATDASLNDLEEIITLTVRKMKSDYLGMAGRLKRLEEVSDV
jgi:hypothetical protein